VQVSQTAASPTQSGPRLNFKPNAGLTVRPASHTKKQENAGPHHMSVTEHCTLTTKVAWPTVYFNSGYCYFPFGSGTVFQLEDEESIGNDCMVPGGCRACTKLMT
jgi:hypothetical protein